jgi:hypothetical protein
MDPELLEHILQEPITDIFDDDEAEETGIFIKEHEETMASVEANQEEDTTKVDKENESPIKNKGGIFYDDEDEETMTIIKEHEETMKCHPACATIMETDDIRYFAHNQILHNKHCSSCQELLSPKK